MKVYGGTVIGGIGKQQRCIVAAKNKREAALAVGVSYHQMTTYWTETGNTVEIEAATAQPGVPLYTRDDFQTKTIADYQPR